MVTESQVNTDDKTEKQNTTLLITFLFSFYFAIIYTYRKVVNIVQRFMFNLTQLLLRLIIYLNIVYLS